MASRRFEPKPTRAEILARLRTLAATTKIIEFDARNEPEDLQIEGFCSAIDDATDRETAAWIRAELASGNPWAWCTVVVTARLGQFEATDALGGCSYRSREDFEEHCLPDMKAQTLEELAEQIHAASGVFRAMSFVLAPGWVGGRRR